MKLFLLLNRLTLTLLTPVFYSYILSILYIRPSHATSSMFYTECASIHVCHISDSFQSFYPSNPCWSEDVGNILRILHGSELSIGRIEVWIEVKKKSYTIIQKTMWKCLSFYFYLYHFCLTLVSDSPCAPVFLQPAAWILLFASTVWYYVTIFKFPKSVDQCLKTYKDVSFLKHGLCSR